MTRRRRSRGLVILVSVIVALLVAEAALVAFVFISPSAKEELGGVAESVQRIWVGTEDDPGIRTRSARAAHEAYEEWIVPLWRGPQPPPPDPEFTACVECHPDYATQRKFNVYMNHPLHAELGTACETCHPQNPHPNPPRPQERMCAECHDQVDDKDGCAYCHPPASLPHFYYFGAPRESVTDCDVCHPKDTFAARGSEPLVERPTLTGADEDVCLGCHEDTTCSRCHGEPHPPGWDTSHGTNVGYGGAMSCRNCHTATWCADRCHAVTDLNPFVPKPLPTLGVRP